LCPAMDLLIVALILSFPIFYIYGIAKFISSLNQSKKKSEPSTYSLSTRTQYVSIAVQELQAIQSTNPAATLGDVIKSYQVELNQQTPAPAPPAASLAPANTTPASKAPQEQPPAKPQNILNQPINELWQSWYSQNSINLVLYL